VLRVYTVALSSSRQSAALWRGADHGGVFIHDYSCCHPFVSNKRRRQGEQLGQQPRCFINQDRVAYIILYIQGAKGVPRIIHKHTKCDEGRVFSEKSYHSDAHLLILKLICAS